MRRTIAWGAAVCGVLMFSTRADAQSRSHIEGFGGMTFGTTATSAPTFGGTIALPLTDHIHVIGEGGRLTDLKSSAFDLLDGFAPYDVRLSAWYGEGGVRFIASPHLAVRPYVEATAGIARLSLGIDGAGGFGSVADVALGYLGTTEPMLGAGAGVMLQGGPVLVDAGYRYKRINNGTALASALTLSGDSIEVNQVRIGIGVRF